jgi:hypothetical protein
MHKETEHTPSRNHLTIYILLVIIIIQGLFNTYLLTGNSVSLPASIGIDSLGVKKALLEIEYDKVGWKKNYDLVGQATRMQMKDQIPKIEEYIATEWWKNPASGSTNTDTPTPPANKTLTTDEMNKIVWSAYIEGKKDAPIIVIEYSEMECPYCAMQYHDTKIHENLTKQYGEKISFSYKNNRWANHPWTEIKALGLLCAWQLGEQDAYTKFYTYVMDRTTFRPSKRDWDVFPVGKLVDAARATWVDIAAWQACVDKKDTLARFTWETAEAGSVGLRGTPGTLILNTKTGKYDIVIGAAEYKDFTQKIDALMQ